MRPLCGNECGNHMSMVCNQPPMSTQPFILQCKQLGLKVHSHGQTNSCNLCSS